MKTNQNTFVFKNGSNTVQINDNKISTNLLMKIKRLEDGYFINIPVFNIFFDTNTKEEIQESVHESLMSFFNYWIKIQGKPKFHTQMKKLGFTVEIEDNDDIEIELMQNDELLIA